MIFGMPSIKHGQAETLNIQIFISINMELGDLLKSLRLARKFTLRNVEIATGISNSYLCQLENGKTRKPSPKILESLAKHYKVSFAQLMDAAGYPSFESNNEMVKENAKKSSAFENLTNEEQEKLLEYLQFLRTRKTKEETKRNCGLEN